VTAQDAYGNTATGYTGTVHFASSDPRASLPADSRLTNGTATFAAVLYTAGSQSVTATDTANGNLMGTQTGIAVTAAAASRLVVTTDAGAPDVAGTAFDVTVTALDPYGNTDTNYVGTVHFTSADPLANLAADYAFQPGDQGQATFYGVTALYTAGPWDVTAADSGGLTGSATVNVVAAPAVAFQILAPAGVAPGTPFDVTVVAVDPYGNIDTHYTGTVTFSSSDTDPGVLLPPDYSFTSADAGVVTFPGGVTLITPGDQSLTVTDTSSGITGSASVTISAGNGPSGNGSGLGKVPTTVTSLPGPAVRPWTAETNGTEGTGTSGTCGAVPAWQPLSGVRTGSAAAVDQLFGAEADPLARGANDNPWPHWW
jgi:hypothetical protein